MKDINTVFLYIVLTSVIFYILSQFSLNSLVIFVIIIIMIYFFEQKDVPDKLKNIIEDTEGSPVESTNYRVDKNSRDFKYLQKDDTLLEIVRDMRFVKRYDRPRYTDMINTMNIFMQTYMFMMADRWDIEHFLPLMKDLYIDVLEIMYSFYMVVPTKMRHVFGFHPLERLKSSIERFRDHGKELLDIVRFYGKDKYNLVHLIDIDVEPSNSRESNLMLP